MHNQKFIGEIFFRDIGSINFRRILVFAINFESGFINHKLKICDNVLWWVIVQTGHIYESYFILLDIYYSIHKKRHVSFNVEFKN